MDRKKIAMWLSVLVLAGFSAWTAMTIPDHPEPIPESERKPQQMTYGENTIREEAGGKLFWELTTASTPVDMKTQATTFKDAKGKNNFPDRKGARLTAAGRSYDSKKKVVKLEGGVEAVMSDGTKLTSEALEWVGAKDVLIATGKAHVEKDDMTLDADRIEGREQFQNFKAKGSVHLVKDKKKKGAESK